MGKLALVTGASSGLGSALCRSLARQGIDLIMVARHAQPMTELAAELTEKYGVRSEVMPVDLSDPTAIERLVVALDDAQHEPDILINNAGFALSGPFLGQDIEQVRSLLQVDVVSLVELTHRLGKRMQQRGSGHILLVSSVGAFQPNPLISAYGAAKAFVQSFGEALHLELAPQVVVTVVSPGAMDTGFFTAAGFELKPFLRRSMDPPSWVADKALEALFRGKPTVVPGVLNRVSTLSTRLFPRQTLARLVMRIMKP